MKSLIRIANSLPGWLLALAGSYGGVAASALGTVAGFTLGLAGVTWALCELLGIEVYPFTGGDSGSGGWDSDDGGDGGDGGCD